MADPEASETEITTSNSQANGSIEPVLANENSLASESGNQVQPQAPPAATSRWDMLKAFAFRLLIIYFISSMFRRPQQPQQQDLPGAGNQVQSGSAAVFPPAMNLFPKNTILDMWIYITEHDTNYFKSDSLVWKEERVVYGDWNGGPNLDGSYVKAFQLSASENVQNNGSLYIHVYFVKHKKSPNPSDGNLYSPKYTLYQSKRLTKFKRRYFVKTMNLLTGKTDADPNLIRAANDSDFEILSHWHENLTLNIIDDHTSWTPGSVPPPLDEYVKFIHSSNEYYPIFFFNDYWNLNSDYQPLNETVTVLNFTLTFQPMSLFKWQMYAAQGMRNKWLGALGNFSSAGDDDAEQDNLKRTLLETNAYLLGLTAVITLVHSVFEFLAFKNDIQFWRNKKSLEGLSVRSVFFNVFQSVIVCLYIFDNETNFVIKCSVCVGLAIELWKITKVVDVKLNRNDPLFGFLPKITFEDKSSYTNSHTKEYDMLAFKYLSWALYPLFAGFVIYTLVYNEHRGWYSWVLNTIYGFLLVFGFIMMTPQLFINYKLKSVAHLPWRMLTYKALNTFIDDIFAFVIQMPLMYRIGCFRDDIVFFIYLYQKYIYPVDPARVNEFGTSKEMIEEYERDKQLGNENDTSPASDGNDENLPKSIEEKKED